jgi:peptidoglycan/LPS O-acetylase OafA/YrhL
MMSDIRPFHLGYRPSLNGIRGVAVSLVVLAHGDLIPGGFSFLAVNTFFVLSGFLITSLLLEEWDGSHTISLRNFYLRRALRLLPALVTMLVLFVAYAFLTDPHGRAVRELYDALRALFYVTNWAGIYHLGRFYSLAHTWSLSIEEQFYIIWPCLLLLLLRRVSRPSMLTWISLGVFSVVLLRIGLCVVYGHDLETDARRLTIGTDTRADSLLLGCFAAVFLTTSLSQQMPRLSRLLPPAAYGSVAVLLALGFCREVSIPMILVGWFIASLAAMIIILYLVTGSPGWLHGVLQNPLLVYLGEISYGLYVWHVPILRALQQHQLPWRYMSYLLVVLPVVFASYYLIEKPCLQFKKRLHVAQPAGATAPGQPA